MACYQAHYQLHKHKQHKSVRTTQERSLDIRKQKKK
uniref:Uncharacterized protein n=1 Tax=Arundo donax TaxID=35708 RepID=A0A0A9I306_ARUDO